MKNVDEKFRNQLPNDTWLNWYTFWLSSERKRIRFSVWIGELYPLLRVHPIPTGVAQPQGVEESNAKHPHNAEYTE
ncbi:hypothetical protein PoB_000939500 [Plakobranchus ocellatus]|uniref:Uncharacterized protein n=1 Tax=Plakobranchus ocellatus TaxID=259542 RepID=A0AAV3YJI3_9GAST|nr:hypothetical protein PoB_000939500 [Plakobranchus ocellatus]